jgi:surface protein
MLFCLTLLLVSCSKSSTPTTSAKIVLGASALLSGANDVIFYGESVDGNHTFAKWVGQSATEVILDLPEGEWEFKALAWTNPNLEGDIKCYADLVTLSGSNQDIIVSLSAGNCSDPLLNDTGYDVNKAFDLNGCDDLSIISNFSASCLAANRGHGYSFKIIANDWDMTAPGSEVINDSLFSSCLNAGVSNVKMPFGTADAPFAFTVRTFANNDCTGVSQDNIIKHGVNVNPSVVKVYDDGTNYKTYMLDAKGLINLGVTSVSPNAGAFAGGDTVTIYGTNFIPGITATIDGTACASSTYISPTSMDCVTPAKAGGTYNVEVTNPDTLTATLAASFTYQAAPTITATDISAGAIAGGTTLTITGTGFVTGITASVNSVPCITSTYVSATSMLCTTPASAAGGPYAIAVTNIDGQSGSLVAAYTYQAAPALTSIDITTGPLAGNTTLTLTGTDFMSGLNITIDGTNCTTSTYVSATSATCVTPAKTAGSYDVVITNPDSQAGTITNGYTYATAALAYSTSVLTEAGANDGTVASTINITLTGDTFTGTNGNDFLGGGKASSINVPTGLSAVLTRTSATTLTLSLTGTAISHTNADDISNMVITFAPTAFAVNTAADVTNYINSTIMVDFADAPAPTISDVNPPTDILGGGATITIKGTNFVSGLTATIGGNTCTTPTFINSTEMTCTAPAGAAGTYNVVVTNPDAQTATLANSFIYAPVGDSFISTWQTSGANETITIPLRSGETYNFVIDWGDGSSGIITSDSSPTHNYISPGTHTIKITGVFPTIYFNNIAADKDKIYSISDLGNVGWTSFNNSFYGCSNLGAVSTSVGSDTANVTDMSGMFRSASNATPTTTGWDTSNVTDMTSMFELATSANPDVTGWNINSVTTISNMFNGASSANPDVSGLDVTNVTNMDGVLKNATMANPDISDWNIPNVTSMVDAFDGTAISITNYSNALIMVQETNFNPNVDLGNVPQYHSSTTLAAKSLLGADGWTVTDLGVTNSFVSVWKTTTNNESITIPLKTGEAYNFNIDWGDGNNQAGITSDAPLSHTYTTAGEYEIKIDGTFPAIEFNNTGDKDKIESIAELGSVGWTTFENAFYGCLNLAEVAGGDTSNVTSMNAMFRQAQSVEPETSNWNTALVLNMNNMFKDAMNADPDTSNWDVSSVTSMNYTFRGAVLANPDVSNWNVSSVLSFNGLFFGATIADPDMSAWNMGSATIFTGMLTSSGISVPNYTNFLIAADSTGGATSQALGNVGDGTVQFTAAASAPRSNLVGGSTWTITDGGLLAAAAPVLSSLSANNDVRVGGITITLTGTDFVAGAVASIDGEDCITTTFNSPTSLDCIVPPNHVVGTYDVRVTNPDSQFSELSSVFTYN